MLVEGSGLKEKLPLVNSKIKNISKKILNLIDNWKSMKIPYQRYDYMGRPY